MKRLFFLFWVFTVLGLCLSSCSVNTIEQESYETSYTLFDEASSYEESNIAQEQNEDYFELLKAGAEKNVMDQPVKNLLLIGNDRRPGQKEEMRSDAMMVLSINTDKKVLALTSLMRDMYIPCADGLVSPINLSYFRGGMDLLDRTIEENFGIHIDGNLEVDFYRFVDLMQLIGPIQIELNDEEAAWLNNSSAKGSNWYWWNDEIGIQPDISWELHAGINTMTPEQVEDYCRLRKVGNADFERTERQQRVMKIIYDKLKSYDTGELIQFVENALQYIHTDMTQTEILGYLYTIWSKQINSFENYRLPLDGTYVNQSVEDENYGKLQVIIPEIETNKKQCMYNIYSVPEYDDVLYSDEFADDIIYVTKKGYMGATGRRLFNPSFGITRGSIAQILYVIDGKPKIDNKASFSDVDENRWYYNGICWASNNGIISGNKNKTFQPDTYITNQQLYAMLYKYAEYKGYDTSVNKKITDVKDRKEISDYAVKAVKWAKGHKMMLSNCARPREITTRAELARIITTLDQYVIKS